jgi:uncharacterized protein YggE
MAKNWFFIFLLAAPAFAQLETNTLTISATRQINLQPDQAVFAIGVNSSTSESLDQVVAALSALSITAADLSSVDNWDPSTLQWSFTLATPLTSLTATIASLTKLEQTIGQNDSGLSLTFSINGTQVSPQSQQSQPCSTSDLIADATTQAQKIAAASGLTLGPLLKLSNAQANQPSTAVLAYYAVGGLSGFLLGPGPQPMTCSLSVQFQLTR